MSLQIGQQLGSYEITSLLGKGGEAGRVRKIREKLGLTQAGIASLLDVKTNTVYRWEAGILPHHSRV